MGINCLWIPAPQPAEDGFWAHFYGYFSKRRVNLPVSKSALLLLRSKCQHRKIVSSCLAGRFLVRLRSGSGRTYTSRMGRRPAFFVQTSLVRRYLSSTSEVAMLLSVRPASHHICQPEFHPSGSPRYIRARKPPAPVPLMSVGSVPRFTLPPC